MRKLFAIFGSAAFFLLAPGVVAGLAPRWIAGANAAPSRLLWRIPGILFIAAGTVTLLDSFARFALEGLGTPAPVFPTRRLVVGGLYRYVRNPMYGAVIAIILGQCLLWASVRVVGYALLVWAGFHIFVLAYEEPVLRAAYGGEYDAFCRNVPRWIPRLTPWQAPGQS